MMIRAQFMLLLLFVSVGAVSGQQQKTIPTFPQSAEPVQGVPQQEQRPLVAPQGFHVQQTTQTLKPERKIPAVELGSDGRTTVRGIVLDASDSNNHPVAGALVFLIPETPSALPLKTVADPKGLFDFVYVRNEKESFTLFAVTPDKSRMGNEFIREDHNPGVGLWGSVGSRSLKDFHGRLSVWIRDTRCSFTTGTVKDAFGKPIEGALLHTDRDYVRFRSTSDAAGRFELYSMYDYPHAICAAKPGDGLAYLARPIGKWKSAEQERETNIFLEPVNLVLAPVSPFRVLVTDAKDLPVSDCGVTAFCSNEQGSDCSVPAFSITDKNGVAAIDWMPNHPDFRIRFVLQPPDRLRQYSDGSAAKLIPHPEKNVFSTKNAVSGQLKCVIPFKAELTIKVVDPFAVSDGEPELKAPNAVANAGDYWHSLDFSRHQGDRADEFFVYSDPGWPFWIWCRLGDGENSVLPTVRGVMGDGFTPLKTTITLQKGVPIRLRLFDENGKRTHWKQSHYMARIAEIDPANLRNAEESSQSYDFSDSFRKAANEGQDGAEELVCSLPPGKFQVKADCFQGFPQQQAVVIHELPVRQGPVVLPKEIKDNRRNVTVSDVPDEKEIVLEFHVVDPNVKEEPDISREADVTEESTLDAVSLLEKHIDFLDEFYQKIFKMFGHRADGQSFLLLTQVHLLKNKAILLKHRIERTVIEDEKEILKAEWIQRQREFINAAQKLSITMKAAWSAGTVFFDDYLDILDLIRNSKIELLLETSDRQAVQTAWENYQEELGSLRGWGEELFLLKKRFRFDSLLAIRLALYEVRYQCASWKLRHLEVPEPVEHGTEEPLPSWRYDPAEELNKQIRQHLDDQFQTSAEYVIATESAWKAGTRLMPFLINAFRRQQEIEIRKLRHEAKSEDLFDRTAEVLERHIKQAEELYKSHKQMLSVMMASPGLLRREGCHLNQLRVLIASWEIELLRLRREHTESEAEKAVFQDEIRRLLDSRAESMQAVVKYVEESYVAGMCTQKDYLDIRERCVRLELERLEKQQETSCQHKKFMP